MTSSAFVRATRPPPFPPSSHEIAVVEATPFLASHVEAIVARAETLQYLGEAGANPRALVRAARLFTIAIRMADEVDRRAGARFSRSDLVHVRDEHRDLVSEVMAAETLVMHGSLAGPAASSDNTTLARSRTERAFREVVLRIEQRLAA